MRSCALGKGPTYRAQGSDIILCVTRSGCVDSRRRAVVLFLPLYSKSTRPRRAPVPPNREGEKNDVHQRRRTAGTRFSCSRLVVSVARISDRFLFLFLSGTRRGTRSIGRPRRGARDAVCRCTRSTGRPTRCTARTCACCPSSSWTTRRSTTTSILFCSTCCARWTTAERTSWVTSRRKRYGARAAVDVSRAVAGRPLGAYPLG